MTKKLIVLALIIVLAASVFSLSACSSNQPLIVYLGDSIAEGIAGMSPISERERYAYYSVLGIRNNYIYKNRAVSGHQTKQMLDLIKQEDSDVRMMQTVLKTADIIHVSILGNDLLQNNLGELILDIANGNNVVIDDILSKATVNFSEIVDVLKGYNPDATLMFQTVYNPMFPEATLINEATRTSLAALDITEEQYRQLAADILARLNGIIHAYLQAHPGAFHIIDANAEFQRIFNENPERGRALIFGDFVHPSIEGHAVMADLIQAKLEDLDLAKAAPALRRYKDLKIEQLKDLYSDSLDVSAIKKQIRNAKSNEEVTQLYLAAIKGKTPVYA
ncbi:MAG: SGNH/GDSL hydrolase family protein [Clostridia bacterium]|nr:SGNH/GDSL hydrolase family protein [Clostridia bacterium]